MAEWADEASSASPPEAHSFRSGRHAKSPGPLSPDRIGREFDLEANVRETNVDPRSESEESPTMMDGEDRNFDEHSLHPSFERQHRRLDSADTMGRQHPMTRSAGSSLKKRTLVVYSGPTSLDRSVGKNDIYLKNFEYFLHHGIECDGADMGQENGSSHSVKGHKRSQEYPQQRQQLEMNDNIRYVIVLTQEVADRYTASDGLITMKQMQCNSASNHDHEPLITVLIREDKCYDMESILVVLRTIDVTHLYDYFVYINCGLAGPKFGPNSPVSSQFNPESSSWTELYTSLLSDKVQMVGHTVNTHFNTTYSPHIQSFLFAVNTPMIDIWLETGALYECGISNQEFKDDILRMALVWRYEVGISRVLLERGYSIAAAFMHQGGKIGVPLIIDSNSTFGRHLNQEEVLKSDIFKEDGLRLLTESSFPHIDDYRKYAILSWDTYVFFKVSRLVPHDIQRVMHYNNLGPVELVPNDARLSSQRAWRWKAGASLWDEPKFWLGIVPYIDNPPSNTICRGRRCKLEKVASQTGELLGVFVMIVLFLWYFAALKFVEKRLSVQRLKELRRKWK